MLPGLNGHAITSSRIATYNLSDAKSYASVPSFLIVPLVFRPVEELLNSWVTETRTGAAVVKRSFISACVIKFSFNPVASIPSFRTYGTPVTS